MSEHRRRLAGRQLVTRSVRAARRILWTGSSEHDEAPLSPPESLLVGSELFDVDWYTRQAGTPATRVDAVRHYLRTGAARGWHPHRLFDPDFVRPQFGDDELAGRDPFVVYLRNRAWRKETHPLFDTKGYLKRNPDALSHPFGPLGHYDEVGAAAGLRPNNWLTADETGRWPDLRDWVDERWLEWRSRRVQVAPMWTPGPRPADEHDAATEWHDREPVQVDDGTPVVSVLLDAGTSAEHLTGTVRSLAAQTFEAWEVLVVDRGHVTDLPGLLGRELRDASTLIVQAEDDDVAFASNAALEQARGEHIAFLAPGDRWEPDRLRILVGISQERQLAAVADDMVGIDEQGNTVYAVHGHQGQPVCTRNAIDLGRIMLRRDVLDDLGGFDPALKGAWTFDLVLRLSLLVDVHQVPVVGTRRSFRDHQEAHRLRATQRPPVEQSRVESWADVSLNLRLNDWDELEGRLQDPDTVSVIIPTYDDWEMTHAAVASVMAAATAAPHRRVQCIVWDNGSDGATSVVLDSLPGRYPGLEVLHSPVNHGFALGNNLAVPYARGDVVVFLNNDTTVPEGWLDPLVESLADPDVLGAQSLLLYPTGSIQSAGVAFPSTGGIPHAFLQGFPREDAAGVESLELSALTGAAMALRFADVVALRGFDPVFSNGMEDIDLCHRLQEMRDGHFRVLPAAPVIHHESRSAGRLARYVLNRRLYLDRWAGRKEPRDDVRLWASRGLRVVDHQVDEAAPLKQRHLIVPSPILVRTERLAVTARPQRLRWAIKNPAPFGAEGERWGDTHFARAVAGALRECGQEVVIDHRPEFERATSRHDDVALVLRGLAPFRPSPEQVTIGWVISHPEMLGRSEATTYDQVVAASIPWSKRMSRQWNLDIEPMLQATDPALFHPDRAVPDTGHPVLFVGSSRNVHRPIVRDSVEAGLPISVYGGQWGQFIPRRYVKATYLDNAELGAAYRSAGVVLNDHWEDMRTEGFISNRLFDAVAAGARVISDDVEDLEVLFGDSVQVYRSHDDLVRLSSLAEPDVVFGDDEARRSVAARVAREHSFRARAERLVEIAVEARRRRGFTD